jgi:hypothetical protein
MLQHDTTDMGTNAIRHGPTQANKGQTKDDITTTITVTPSDDSRII